MAKWALRLVYESKEKEKMTAFLDALKASKYFYIETDFDVFQNVYKALIEWDDDKLEG